MKIGTSLSLCISSICRGEVLLTDVICIITSTHASTDLRWNWLMGMYSRSYWQAYSGQATAIANELRRSGRIIQPRLTDQILPAPRALWIEY